MLQQIATDLFSEQEYCLVHEFNDRVEQLISIENVAEDIISLGTYFMRNGDVMSDPSMLVKFDTKNKKARICNFNLDTAGLYYTFDFENCSELEDKEEVVCNNYLNRYLKELLESVQNDSKYFLRVAI